jgi:cytochrome c-type biogenesis protein CcmH/NrfG
MNMRVNRIEARSEPQRFHRRIHRPTLIVALSLLMLSLSPAGSRGQSGHSLFGDIKVTEKTEGLKPLTLDVILYNLAGFIVARQRVSMNGRYRFLGLRPGEYDLAVEVETAEVARIRVLLGGGAPTDFRQDLEFEWKSGMRPSLSGRKETVSAEDFYKRPTANQSMFEKGQSAVDAKKYPEAIAIFQQLLQADAQDFQAWTELGTTYLLADKKEDAEKAYLRATEARPKFALAQLNLGRVRSTLKKFEEAIPPLKTVVELQPSSAEANFLLGEAYLQVKKGSLAVGYLTEAARLGRADAHLRLATLYNAAGMKDRAAAEYEEFLKKTPNYADRKKLEAYINANKKP